jgi:hypothetical protein
MISSIVVLSTSLCHRSPTDRNDAPPLVLSHVADDSPLVCVFCVCDCRGSRSTGWWRWTAGWGAMSSSCWHRTSSDSPTRYVTDEAFIMVITIDASSSLSSSSTLPSNHHTAGWGACRAAVGAGRRATRILGTTRAARLEDDHRVPHVGDRHHLEYLPYQSSVGMTITIISDHHPLTPVFRAGDGRGLVGAQAGPRHRPLRRATPGQARDGDDDNDDDDDNSDSIWLFDLDKRRPDCMQDESLDKTFPELIDLTGLTLTSRDLTDETGRGVCLYVCVCRRRWAVACRC